MPREGRGGTGAAGAFSAVVVVAAVAGAVYSGVLVLDRAREEVYGIPGWGVVLTLGLLAATLAGFALMLWSRQLRLGAVVMTGAALTVLGLLGAASFGLLVLPVAVAVLAWGASCPWPVRRRAAGTAGAVLVGLPVPLLVIFAFQGPLVDCGPNGVSGGENVFLGIASAGGSGVSEIGSSEGGGTGGGHASGDGYEYSYECRDGELVRFDLRWR